MIISHNHPKYKAKFMCGGRNRYNGAYYYSKEICELMVPRIKTTRNWITINIPGEGADHSIVFIHNNNLPELYSWLSDFSDLILVCGVPSTCEKVKHLGTPVYLPLSVDVQYVERFKQNEHPLEACFAGRGAKRLGIRFPEKVEYLEGMERSELLKNMRKYKRVYAVGRTAIEAKILGCDIGVYDPRYPDPSIWQIFDTRKAAKVLQGLLDNIDE